MITLICEQCKQPYHAKPYMAKKSEKHFCGFACYGEWQKINRFSPEKKRVQVICYTCEKVFDKTPSAVSARNFCCRQCFADWRKSDEWRGENNPVWLGGHASYRGANWESQRKQANERDKNACQRCGFCASNLPVHHIKPFRLFPNYQEANELINLVTLCPVCHCKEEAIFWRNNPDLRDPAIYPNCVVIKNCEKCREDFPAASGSAKVCPLCCNAVCVFCSSQFFSRRIRRDVKYCSVECRIEHRKQTGQKYQIRVCEGCEIEFTSKHKTTRFCSQKCHHATEPPAAKAALSRNPAVQVLNQTEA